VGYVSFATAYFGVGAVCFCPFNGKAGKSPGIDRGIVFQSDFFWGVTLRVALWVHTAAGLNRDLPSARRTAGIHYDR